MLDLCPQEQKRLLSLWSSNAAKRIAHYRKEHLFPVREPYAERAPALPLWHLSDDFRKQSPRRKHLSPGTRAPFIGPLITSTAQVFDGRRVN